VCEFVELLGFPSTSIPLDVFPQGGESPPLVPSWGILMDSPNQDIFDIFVFVSFQNRLWSVSIGSLPGYSPRGFLN
jgi:hypothetical protein